jgi:acyl transferase domain-containing protein/acyl carrier protein
MTRQPGTTNYRSLIEDALVELKRARAELVAMRQAKSEPIAITGMACRFPGGANDPRSYWRMLREGVDAITEIPSGRWDVEALFDPNPAAPGKMYTRLGGFIENVDHFDAEFFALPPREATELDPQQRLILETSWEALEDAGQPAEALRGVAAGVFLGLFQNDYSQYAFHSGDLKSINAYNCLSSLRSMVAGRLSYFLDLRGPTLQLDTACSSSLLAVHLACQSLRLGESDIALAGGVNLILSPEAMIGACKLSALAPDGRSRTFSASANGYARGEGCGVVVLRRLSDALARGDLIYAIIRGSAVNHDGASNGLTAPNGGAQEAVVKAALQAAAVQASEVQYVETHGTGTLLGDPIEVLALGAALCRERAPDRPLFIGSVKTNIGHLESAAGVASLMKTALALQNGEIPPHLHFTEPNPHIPWTELSVEVPTRAIPWPATKGRRLAGVSAFGMSGTNVHVILEEAPAADSRSDGEASSEATPARPAHILALSAKDEEALRALAGRYEKFVTQQASLDVADLCYSANTGRSHFHHRLAIVAASGDDLRARLGDMAAATSLPTAAMSGRPPKVAFVFPGRVTRLPGLGRTLYATQPLYRHLIHQCNELLLGDLEPPLLAALDSDAETAAALFDNPLYSEAVLFAVEYALAELWRAWGIEPILCTGRGVGEIAAACTAGVFSLDEALRLLVARARLGAAISAGPLKQSTDAAQAAYTATICNIHYHQPSVAIISADAGGLTEADVASAGYWLRRAQPDDASAEPPAPPTSACEIILEIGPETSPAGSQQVRPSKLASLCASGDDWSVMLASLAALYSSGARIDWVAFDRGYGRKRLRLPNYPFRRRRYWIDRPAPQQPAAPASSPASATASLGEREETARWLYAIEWQPKPLKFLPRIGAARAPQTWLILSDRQGYGHRLAQRIAEQGDDYIQVFCDDDYKRAGNREFSINPATADHVARLLSEQAREGRAPVTRAIHLWSLDALPLDRNRESSPLQESAKICAGVLHLVQALVTTAPADPRRLCLVTRGAQAAGSSPAVNVEQATLWGLGKVIQMEHPELRCALIDLDPSRSAEQVDDLMSELNSQTEENQVAWRQGERRVARLGRMACLLPAEPPRIPAQASYLITGGCGALGLEVAQWLARFGARRLILVGRSRVTDRAAQVIDRIERQGTRVLAIQADITRRDEVVGLLSKIDAPHAPLKGIIHAAGVLDDGTLLRQDEQRFRKVMAPKVAGAWHLHELTFDLPLDFFVLFSSAASMLGSPGQGAYAAANAFLDALAYSRQAQAKPALSINWGPWADSGMAARVSERGQDRWASLGIQSLPPERALEVLGALLEPPSAQAGVLRIEWPQYLHQFPGGEAPKFFEQLAPAHQPPAEAEAPLARRIREASPGRRRSILLAHLRAEVAAVLGVAAAQEVSPRQSFFDLGLDSLMTIELKSNLESSLGQPLSATLFFDNSNIEELAEYICENVRLSAAIGSQS